MIKAQPKLAKLKPDQSIVDHNLEMDKRHDLGACGESLD